MSEADSWTEEAVEEGAEASGGGGARSILSKVAHHASQSTAEIDHADLSARMGIAPYHARLIRVGLSLVPDGAEMMTGDTDGQPTRAADLAGAVVEYIQVQRLGGAREGGGSDAEQ